MSQPKALKAPCRYCGTSFTAAPKKVAPSGYAVICPNCDARGPRFVTGQEATDEWNGDWQPPVPPAERLRQYLEENHDKAVIIAYAALCGLYIERGELMPEEASCPVGTGSDFVDTVLEGVMLSGADKFVESLRHQ